jgi:DeoR/GlpR family transcriptional regulator of sugar metabolism
MMLQVERQRRIIEEVGRRTSVRVAELAGVFQVADETIRRDLDSLQEKGLLIRSHGGAVATVENSQELHYTARETQNLKEKVAIAREALARIREDDTIILDSSSTALQLARSIPDMRLTVVTNSLRAAVELSGKTAVRVISTGGTLLTSSLSFIGPLAEKGMENYHVNKAFLSCRGFAPQEGASDANELQALLKRKMLNRADEKFLLVDSAKLGVKSLSIWAQAGDFTWVITDAGAPDGTIGEIERAGVEVIRAE